MKEMTKLRHFLLPMQWSFRTASCFLLLSSCGSLAGSSSDNSQGTQDIVMTSSFSSFNAAENKEAYKAFPLQNNLKQDLTLTGLNFTNNLCNAFSLFTITDDKGKLLLNNTGSSTLFFPKNEIININIRFKPANCPYTDYTTILQMSFADADGRNHLATISLESKGQSTGPPPPPGPQNCADIPKNHSYKDNYTSGIPKAGTYYLRIERMRAFIFPESVPDQARLIGTDIGGADLAPFEPTYIKITVTDGDDFERDYTLNTITACDDFRIPSPLSDIYFRGAETLLTADAETNGKMIREVTVDSRDTQVELNNLKIRLRSTEIKGDSLIKDTQGGTNIFQISVILDSLTTRKTGADTVIGTEIKKAVTRQGLGFFPFTLDETCAGQDSCAMVGSSLVGGSITLVGKGRFDNSDDSLIGSESANDFLIKKAASLYVELKVSLTEREGTQ